MSVNGKIAKSVNCFYITLGKSVSLHSIHADLSKDIELLKLDCL